MAEQGISRIESCKVTLLTNCIFEIIPWKIALVKFAPRDRFLWCPTILTPQLPEVINM